MTDFQTAKNITMRTDAIKRRFLHGKFDKAIETGHDAETVYPYMYYNLTQNSKCAQLKKYVKTYGNFEGTKLFVHIDDKYCRLNICWGEDCTDISDIYKISPYLRPPMCI
jgi:hypothetical protein